MSSELKTVTRAEVAKHNTPEDAWMIVYDKVYNVTKFAPMHPGGKNILLAYAGQDATEVFFELHRADVLVKFAPRLVIAQLEPTEVKKEGKNPEPVDYTKPDYAISKVPYAEPSFWQGWRSTYFNDSHIKFRDAVRKFFTVEVLPELITFEELGKEPPISFLQKLGAFGIHACRMGPGPHLKLVKSLPGGVKPEEFDYFHEMIVHEELTRLGLPGASDGLGAGMVIGLPPVFVFGPRELAMKIGQEVLSGNKRICLAISEPYAGSDVANIKTTATKSACGQFYIVNGCKKWITQGDSADYFTTAVRTGGPGQKGISMLVIPRVEGVNTKKIITSYSGAAGTTYITFENVKVPVGNLLGKENQGFKIVMSNFNHERWMISVAVNAGIRRSGEETFKWAMQRKAFGKRLAEQPVIRQKLATLFSKLEASQNWLENITYQMTQMDYMEQTKKLSGAIALHKLLVTRTAYEVNDIVCQVFGGRALTRSGMGANIERAQRSVKYGAILGGSEEIMADLALKMAVRKFPLQAKL